MGAKNFNKMHGVSLLLSALYICSAGGISVTFGTSGGPIVPPTPAPPTQPPRPPYRVPAPVWEDDTGDIPNPNPYKAPTPPQLAHYFPTKTPAPYSSPQPSVQPAVRPPAAPTRYTNIGYAPNKLAVQPSPASTLSPAKSFVNAYAQPTKPAPTQNTQTKQETNTQTAQNRDNNNNDNGAYNHNNNNDDGAYNHNNNNNGAYNHNNENSGAYNPQKNYQNIDTRSQSRFISQVPELGIRYIPGYGFKYFTPEQDKDPRKYFKSSKYDSHDKYNALESNDIFDSRQHPNDIDLSYDKFVSQRVKKSPTQQMYVSHQPFTYHQQQLFFPTQYLRQ